MTTSFEVSILLRSDRLSLDELNLRLGVEADRGWSIGDFNPQSDFLRRITAWQLDPDDWNAAPQQQLDSLFSRVELIADVLGSGDLGDTTVTLDVVQVFSETEIGLHTLIFDSRWVELLAKSHASIDMDQYLETEDEEGDWAPPIGDLSMTGALLRIELRPTNSPEVNVGGIVTIDERERDEDQEPRLREVLGKVRTERPFVQFHVIYRQTLKFLGTTETGLALSADVLKSMAGLVREVVVETQICG